MTALSLFQSPPHLPWLGQWIWISKYDFQPVRRCFFRRMFQVGQPGVLKLHISADSRYKLYLDERFIGEGPTAGDLLHYRYESYGICDSIRLEPGPHILAIEVLSYSQWGPVHEVHARGGLVVSAQVEDDTGQSFLSLKTPEAWKVWDDSSFCPNFESPGFPFYSAMGFMEKIDFRKAVCGWTSAEYDDSDWQLPEILGPAVQAESVFVAPVPWVLEPNPLPPMERSPQQFQRVLRPQGVVNAEDWIALIREGRRLRIPPHQRVSIILDQGEETTAYPEVAWENGYDSRVRLTYAEAFSRGWDKAVRDDDGPDTDINGFWDEVITGGQRQGYSPFRWRTFRFLKFQVETGDESMDLTRLTSTFCAYPFTWRAWFKSSHKPLDILRSLSLRTQRLCAHEQYVDCPYYEQLQYIGDASLQGLVTFSLSGDSRLWKNALLAFDRSRLSSGLTQSRYPSRQIQIIPTFSLLYIAGVESYYQHTGDVDTIKRLLPGLEGIIEWFRSFLGTDGLLGKTPWWNFVDWTPAWPAGDPSKQSLSDRGHDSPCAVLNFSLLRSLQSLSRLMGAMNRSHSATSLDQETRNLAQSIIRAFWNKERGLISDTPQGEEFSQHSNILAILTDILPLKDQHRMADHLATDSTLIECNYFFQFLMAEAQAKLRRAGDTFIQLGQWQKVIDLHLTTTPERAPHLKMGSAGGRSDCHAWSAWLPYWELSTVLGIRPVEPAYETLQIAPQLASLSMASGSLPTPRGPVTVHVEQNKGDWNIHGEIPAGTRAFLISPSGKRIELAIGLFHYSEKL